MEAIKRFLFLTFAGLAYITAYIGLPVVVLMYVGEEASYWTLGILSLVAFYFGYKALKKHWEEQRKKDGPKDLTKGQTALVIGFVIFIIIAIAAGDDSTSTQTNTAPTYNTNTLKDLPATQKLLNEKTFYTNALTNIRACAATTCEVLAQTAKNTPVSLEYTSTYDMPEWVSVTWTNAGTQKQAYIHKSTLSSTYTYTPTYNYSNTRHYDDSYEYNYRTGYSGNYDYNYDVEGYGDTGYAYGNIDTSGKYGEGYLYTEDGEEVWVETEWTDYGVLEAYDEYGNWYELETY